MNIVWERKESLNYKSRDLFLTRRSGTLRRAGAINANLRFDEKIGYDKMGNITRLERWGRNGSNESSTCIKIDDLTLSYTGNQLTKITESITGNLKGFVAPSGSTTTAYTYNKNGALAQDFNTKISGIQYNLLNLPQRIQFMDGHNTQYRYDAAGMKRQVIHQTAKSGITVPLGTSTYALSGTNLVGTLTTDYCAGGHIVYENGSVSQILSSEGYLTRSSTGRYSHNFYLKDHLGNNRSVLYWMGNGYSSGNTVINQETNYYPFGMPYEEGFYGDSYSPAYQPYKFGGKELDEMHGLKWYDFEARMKGTIIPPFTTLDPLAEKYYSISPYAYCANNPVRFVDPTGKYIVGTDGKPVTYTDGQWSINASTDVQTIGNAMLLTPEGKEVVDNMIGTEYGISINLSLGISTEGPDKLGQAEISYDSNDNVKGVEITLYKRAIEENADHYRSSRAGANTSKQEALKSLKPTLIERIGQVGSHEGEHATNPAAQARKVGSVQNAENVAVSREMKTIQQTREFHRPIVPKVPQLNVPSLNRKIK